MILLWKELQSFLWTLFDILYCLVFHKYLDFPISKTSVLYDSKSIGEGAYSLVYKGFDKYDSRKRYAIKKIFVQSSEFEHIVLVEIEAFQRFQHPNIMTMVDHTRVLESNRSVAYLLFPYMNRGSLRDVLNDVLAGRTQRAPLVQILRDFRDICAAFNVLHSNAPSYIHQDIKPENILISDRGVPLLADFGSVRPAEVTIASRMDSIRVSEEAASFCTASYRAPELFDPPTGIQLDSRTDVWGIGCLLFAWWYGYSPFESEFIGNTIRVVECTSLRVLSGIPTKASPTAEDQVISNLVREFVQPEITHRPYTRDILVRLDEIIGLITDPHSV